MPLDPRTTALSCQHCTDHKIGCRPLAKWARDLEAEGQDPDSLPAKTKQKGKGKRRNAAGRYFITYLRCRLTLLLEAVDNLTPVMEGIRAEVATEIAALRRDFGNKLAELLTASSNHNAMLRSMCQQAGVNVASLGLRPPPAPLMEDYAASTPSASSVISNISSTSSNLPIGGLSIESPTTRSTASLPIAGPSGVNRDRASVIGMLFCKSRTVLNIAISTWGNPSHRLWPREHRFKAPFKGSVQGSERSGFTGRVTHAILILHTSFVF